MLLLLLSVVCGLYIRHEETGEFLGVRDGRFLTPVKAHDALDFDLQVSPYNPLTPPDVLSIRLLNGMYAMHVEELRMGSGGYLNEEIVMSNINNSVHQAFRLVLTANDRFLIMNQGGCIGWDQLALSFRREGTCKGIENHHFDVMIEITPHVSLLTSLVPLWYGSKIQIIRKNENGGLSNAHLGDGSIRGAHQGDVTFISVEDLARGIKNTSVTEVMPHGADGLPGQPTQVVQNIVKEPSNDGNTSVLYLESDAVTRHTTCSQQAGCGPNNPLNTSVQVVS